MNYNLDPLSEVLDGMGEGPNPKCGSLSGLDLIKMILFTSSRRHNEDNFMQDEDSDMLRREDAILGGTKISFSMLQQRLKAIGIDWTMVWTKMVDVILKSLCMAEDHIPHQVNAFELFGYDLMMDSKMKVWLIEVNSSPSMGQEHLLDTGPKIPL